jgi:cobalt/nickel transport system permease protein
MFQNANLVSSSLDRLDPRGRIVVATAFCLVDTVIMRWESLVLALGGAVAAAALAGFRPRTTVARLAPLNLFMLLVALVVPFTTPGTPIAVLGPWEYSREGLLLAAAVALKGNAMVLAIMALVASMDPIVLGHALHHLGTPDKLVHLMLFSVRYFEVLRREYLRLAAAVKVRGFRPRMNRHTYRAYGYLVGMLFVRSLDRSERIVAAMKCRGFRGRFYLLDHFALTRRDLGFAAATAAFFALMAWVEWV